jgi:uncharacterized membrane protein YuzA (DUF378 family)
LVATIFGYDTLLAKLVYVLVGASALWQLIPLIQGMEAHPRSQAEARS